MRNLRRVTEAAVAAGLTALTLGTATAAAAPSPRAAPPLTANATAAPKLARAADADGEAAQEPQVAAADLSVGLYATHPMASKTGNSYALGTNGDRFCHAPGVSIPWAVRGSDDVDGDGFCPHGQRIQDLEFTKTGRLISTYGGINTNTDSFGPEAGRTAIVPLDVATGRWEAPLLVYSEMTRIIRKLSSGDLAVPLIDPSSRKDDGPRPSGYATDTGGTWRVVKPGDIWFNHAEDLAETPTGDIWLFGSGGEGNAAGIIARSTDGGSTWSLMKETLMPGYYLRYTKGFAMGSTVYASPPRRGMEPIKYENGSWATGGFDVTCENFMGNCVNAAFGVVNFVDGNATVTSPFPKVLGPDENKNRYGYLPYRGVYSASDGFLYAAHDGVLVRTTTVGGPWEIVGQYRDVSDAGAFAVHGDRVYFGGDGGRIYRSDVTVSQAVEDTKAAQAALGGGRAQALEPLLAEIEAAQAEAEANLRADAAEDDPMRAAVVKDAESFVTAQTARIRALAAQASPSSWEGLRAAYRETNAAVGQWRSRSETAAKERTSYWDARRSQRVAELDARTARMDGLIRAIPATYAAEARALRDESAAARGARLEEATLERRRWWQGDALMALVAPVVETNTAASKAASTIQSSVAAEARHRTQVAEAEARRTASIQSSRYRIYERFMARENAASSARAGKKPLPTVSSLAAENDRMARVVAREVRGAESSLASELARTDRVTASEQARGVDWAAIVTRELPGASPLAAAHRDLLLQRVAADRTEQAQAIEDDASIRKASVTRYGDARKQWWIEQGRTVSLNGRLSDAWVRHGSGPSAYIQKVRRQEAARAARLQDGRTLTAAARAYERERLQGRVDRLKAWSRKVNIDDFKIADDTYAQERRRAIELYYSEAALAPKAGADHSEWAARARGAYYARVARSRALNAQWKARISADRYARDAASDALMRLAPR